MNDNDDPWILQDVPLSPSSITLLPLNDLASALLHQEHQECHDVASDDDARQGPVVLQGNRADLRMR